MQVLFYESTTYTTFREVRRRFMNSCEGSCWQQENYICARTAWETVDPGHVYDLIDLVVLSDSCLPSDSLLHA